MRTCRRCGHRFTYEQGFAGLNFSEGKNSLEQLRNSRLVFLCENCAAELRCWLGIAPALPPLPPSAPIAQPPVRLCSEP